MSASLVGSEMCIRDRLHSARPARAFFALTSVLAQVSGQRPGRGHEHLGAVSYTHLTLPTICSV
eukprot:13580716-Alexandrium_andersonii.AAC.1